MPRTVLSFALLCAVFAASNVHAGVVERAKSEGLVRCGGAARPGLAEPESLARSGEWRGLEVEICRAIAAAVLGPAGRFEFHGYETPRDFDAVRSGADEVFFLTASEIAGQNLAGNLIPGPAVYYETHAVMAREDFALRLEDLKGAKICFVTGSGAQRSLESFFETRQLPFLRASFSEDGEMGDAYIAGRCDAVADEATSLAKLRLKADAKASRILPRPLAVFPVMACTGAADGKWAAIVAWTVHTLLRAEIREGSWRADGVAALPIGGTDLGLAQGWQDRLTGAVGTYGDIYNRTLGGKSVYGLARGVNAPSLEGGLFAAPYSE